MHGKTTKTLLLILTLLGCAGTSRYAIRFAEPEQYFKEDRYYVFVFKDRENTYSERLFFKDGTTFRTNTIFGDSTKMAIRSMANKGIDEFLLEVEDPQKRYTYGKSYSSSWGRYTIRGDTLYINDLANYEITAYRLFGWKKKQYKRLIRGDTLLNFDSQTGELVPDSVWYSVYNPQVKLDFMDSRKAWIYQYNEYPKVEK